jgi:hypothetical protein
MLGPITRPATDAVGERHMGLADSIRIMLGKLTPAEIEERDAVARARHEQNLAAIRQAAAHQAAKKAQAEADIAESRREADLYQQRLSRAAGIATLELHCHQDTWQWIKDWMDVGRRYGNWWLLTYQDRITEQGDHLLLVRLSGPQTAEVLTRVARTGQVSGAVLPYERISTTERAIGRRVYDAIGRVLDQVVPDTTGKQPVPPVILDDRPEPD